MQPAAFYIAEAVRLRRLAGYCTIEGLWFQLLARADEFEELARWAKDEDLLPPDQAPVVGHRS